MSFDWAGDEVKRLAISAALPAPSPEALELGKAVLKAASHVAGAPHAAEDCPLFYDGCLCTGENLRHNLNRADVLDHVVEAVMEELVFTYSHPHAAARGEVWVDRSRVPKLYEAYQAWIQWKEIELASVGKWKLGLLDRAIALLRQLVDRGSENDQVAPGFKLKIVELLQDHAKGAQP